MIGGSLPLSGEVCAWMLFKTAAAELEMELVGS